MWVNQKAELEVVGRLSPPLAESLSSTYARRSHSLQISQHALQLQLLVATVVGIVVETGTSNNSWPEVLLGSMDLQWHSPLLPNRSYKTGFIRTVWHPKWLYRALGLYWMMSCNLLRRVRVVLFNESLLTGAFRAQLRWLKGKFARWKEFCVF